MISYGLERRRQIVVRGHDHADIVSAVDRKPYEIDGQGYVDALLLRSPLRVPEFPLYDRSSVLRPAVALRSMRGEGTPSPMRIRAP